MPKNIDTIKNNRGLDTRRDTDKISNFKVTLRDIDEAILTYMNDKLDLSVEENSQKIKVPVIWGNPERWKAVRRDGVYRDQKGKIQLPIILIRRNSISRNDNMAMLNRHLTYQATKTWSNKNRYDKFQIQLGKFPTKELYNITMPDYVNLFYECIIWTEYTQHMNDVIEVINFASDEYWGTNDKFKFKAKIEDYSSENDISDGTQKIVRTNFQIHVTAYLLPESFENKITTKLELTPKRIVFGTEVVSDINDIDKLTPDEGTIKLLTKSTSTLKGLIANSDSSYSQILQGGLDLILPDITITQADNTIVTFPSVKNLDVDNFQGAGFTIQTIWEGLDSSAQNTFVDANDVELYNYMVISQVKTVLDFMTGLVIAEAFAINKFILSQIASGNWAKMDDFAPMRLQTEANSLIKWITGTSMTAVNNPTFTAGSGFGLNGTDQYINSGFNMGTSPSNYSLDNALTGIFNVQNLSDNAYSYYLFSDAAARVTLKNQAGAVRMEGGISCSKNALEASNLGDNELRILVRPDSLTYQDMKNGVQVRGRTINSTTIGSGDIYIGCRNDVGTPVAFYTGTIGGWIISAGVSFDHLDLYNNWVILNTELAAI